MVQILTLLVLDNLGIRQVKWVLALISRYDCSQIRALVTGVEDRLW